MKSTTLLLLALAWVGLVVAGQACNESGIDARKTADALSEEFTDGLEFEDGQTQTGEVPSDVDETLQNYSVTAPRSIGPDSLGFADSADYDTWFDVVLSSYGTDLQAAGVIGAIAHIEQANKDDSAGRYIQIVPSVPGNAFNYDTLTLRARMNHFPGVAGNAFHIRMAFIKDDGSRSRFSLWNLVTHPGSGESTLVPMCTCAEARIEFHDRAACERNPMGDEFTSSVDQAGFCDMWPSCFDDMSHDENRTFPSGSYFYPSSWLQESPEDCTLELWCR